jgi:hypothetical protein
MVHPPSPSRDPATLRPDGADPGPEPANDPWERAGTILLLSLAGFGMVMIVLLPTASLIGELIYRGF